MTFKNLLNDLKAMTNTVYGQPEHGHKAAHTFLTKNMPEIVQALELAILADEYKK